MQTTLCLLFSSKDVGLIGTFNAFRLEETLNLNNKLDQSVRKKEENIRILEKTLQSSEKRYVVS